MVHIEIVAHTIPTPTLKEIINLNILERLINQSSHQSQQDNNDNNNSIYSNNKNNYLYSYLNIILILLNNDKEYINQFINNNNNQIESLYNKLSKYESIKDKERLIFEFIIMNGDGGGRGLDSLFYEYYGYYFMDEIDHQIKLNGGSNKLYTDQQFKEKEEKVFKLVENRLDETSIIRSIEMIAMDYFSITAVSIINKKMSQALTTFANGWDNSNTLSSITYTRLMDFYNMVFQSNVFYYNSKWYQKSFKAILTGQVLNFNQMNSNEIVQLLDYLADNSNHYNFFQVLFSLAQKDIKKMNIIVWKWFISNCGPLLKRLKMIYISTYLTIPFKIDSKELVDFIIEHYSVFRLIPQIANNNNNNHHSSKSLKIDPRTSFIYFNKNNNILVPEFNQNFKITTLELAEYFNNKLIQLVEQHPLDNNIISNSSSSSSRGGSKDNSIGGPLNSISKSQVYYYLFFQAIKNCDIEILKKLDSLDLKIKIKEEEEEDQFKELDINKIISSNNKLKQFKLYNDQSSRIQLLNYLSISGFKSFTSSSFYKLLGQLFYNIGSTVTPLQIKEYIEGYKLFHDEELLQNRSSVSNIQLNETLYLELIVDSVYKLNLPILELLLSSTTTTTTTSTLTLNINQELFITTLLKHSKSTSSIINENTLRNNYQFETILNIIQLLLSKLPSASDQFPIHNIYTYLYKSILQSSNCTINKIKQVHSIYSTNSLDTIITNQDYFNFYYWCHNKSTKLSLLLNILFSKESDDIQHLNQSVPSISPPTSLDLSKFTFRFIADSTFDYILEQFDRVEMFNTYSIYYLNIGRRDLYIKALKEYLQLKQTDKKSNSSSMEGDDNDGEYYQDTGYKDVCYLLDLESYIMALDNDQDIQEILDLKISNYSYQRLLDISIRGGNLNLFKYICTNFNRVKEEESLEPLHFNLLFGFTNSKILKYAIEHHLDQLKLYFGSNTFQVGYWHFNIECATLLMDHFPSVFSIGYNQVEQLVRNNCINQFNYYYQHGYFNNIVPDDQLLEVMNSNIDIKSLNIKI